jgi:hypothetical protein
MISTQDSQKSDARSATDILLSFLKARGCTTKLKQGLQITPAAQGSGRTDVSINHDQIISE